MKLIFAIALLFIFSFTALCQEAKVIRNTEQFLQLEEMIAGARMRKDVAFLDRSISDEFFYTAPVGYFGEIVARSNKAWYLEKVKSNGVVLKTINLADVEANQYGNVAVVTGRMIIKGQIKEKGNEISYQELFTHMFERRGNRWLLVASHSSYVGVNITVTESNPNVK
jgi:ketosteroid isomerase-like protein